jgi:hypothetical protein
LNGALAKSGSIRIAVSKARMAASYARNFFKATPRLL